MHHRVLLPVTLLSGDRFAKLTAIQNFVAKSLVKITTDLKHVATLQVASGQFLRHPVCAMVYY